MGSNVWEMAENGEIKGNLVGIITNTPLTQAKKVWRML